MPSDFLEVDDPQAIDAAPLNSAVDEAMWATLTDERLCRSERRWLYEEMCKAGWRGPERLVARALRQFFPVTVH